VKKKFKSLNLLLIGYKSGLLNFAVEWDDAIDDKEKETD